MTQSSLYDAGWRQGSIVAADLACSWLGHDESGALVELRERFEQWVVCTQDCDLDGALADSEEPLIELRPVSTLDPPDDWGLRSSKIRLSAQVYIDGHRARLFVTPAVLSSQANGGTIADDRRLALKTWLGRRYDRPAVPPQLVGIAREIAKRFGTKGARPVSTVLHDVLMQFDESSDPPEVALFAVIADGEDPEPVFEWLAEASLRVDPSLGVVGGLEVATRSEMALDLLEKSYSADLSSLTWRGESPTGAT